MPLVVTPSVVPAAQSDGWGDPTRIASSGQSKTPLLGTGSDN